MAKIIHTNVGTGIESLAEWMGEGIHEVVGGGELIASTPPDSFLLVKNIYLKEIDQEVILIT